LSWPFSILRQTPCPITWQPTYLVFCISFQVTTPGGVVSFPRRALLTTPSLHQNLPAVDVDLPWLFPHTLNNHRTGITTPVGLISAVGKLVGQWSKGRWFEPGLDNWYTLSPITTNWFAGVSILSPAKLHVLLLGNKLIISWNSFLITTPSLHQNLPEVDVDLPWLFFLPLTTHHRQQGTTLTTPPYFRSNIAAVPTTTGNGSAVWRALWDVSGRKWRSLIPCCTPSRAVPVTSRDNNNNNKLRGRQLLLPPPLSPPRPQPPWSKHGRRHFGDLLAEQTG
jgi:hypothetical protein